MCLLEKTTRDDEMSSQTVFRNEMPVSPLETARKATQGETRSLQKKVDGELFENRRALTPILEPALRKNPPISQKQTA
jgi:hypothetical protein